VFDVKHYETDLGFSRWEDFGVVDVAPEIHPITRSSIDPPLEDARQELQEVTVGLILQTTSSKFQASVPWAANPFVAS